MEKLTLKNNEMDVSYLKWNIKNPKGAVVISHGMAEHPARYDDLAKYFNENGFIVYAIYQLGHGDAATTLGHMNKGDFDLCVDNLSLLVELAKRENNVKVTLLGHSMGSFISQLYIEKYHNIDSLILSGSTKANMMMKMGATLSSILYAFTKDKTKKSPFMDKLAFGSYNKSIQVPRTKFDWLSTDEKVVDTYIEDEYCGWIGSVSFYYNLTHGIAKMGSKKLLKNVDKNLPILVISGTDDPVSNNAKGAKKLYEQYVKLGVNEVSLYLLDGGRHEIYNEVNKAIVYKESMHFIESHI